ncbi:MAG TPA: GNAT family N-acetyltransferase [Acidimicrobiales bacterium]
MDERTVTIRPMEESDLEALRRLFFRLSPETVYRRFFRPIREPSNSVLRYLVAVDHDRREALVAEVEGEIVAVARYDRAADRPDEAEVAIVVEDAWQHRGLGQRLMRRLALLAVDRGVEVFVAGVLGGNRDAVHLVRALSPAADVHFDAGELVVRAPLPTVAA